MHAKHVVFNDCGYGQVVEQIGEQLPNERGPVLALALRVEPVDLRDLSSFMIASEQSNPLRISQFEQHQICYSFYAKSASVNIIAQEEVVCVRDFSANPK